MGLVTGPHANTPRTHSQWVAGPGRTPKGRAVGRERAPYPGRPTRRQAAPPWAPLCRPHSAQSRSQEHAMWGWWRAPRPTQPAPTASG